jgi:folate-binding protein YgfZ
VTRPPTELVVLAGPDARSYLQGQVTQDLAGLEPGASAWSALLDPRGTVVALGVVHVVADDELAFEVPTGVADPALARLRRFVLRAKLELRGPLEVGGAAEAELSSELARINAGVPGPAELARELAPRALDEALLDRSVSYTKGCYPGQELVARMRARNATPPYILRRATLPGPVAPGVAAGDPGFEGAVTSIAPGSLAGTWRALCVLHRKDAATGTVVVAAADGELHALLD